MAKQYYIKLVLQKVIVNDFFVLKYKMISKIYGNSLLFLKIFGFKYEKKRPKPLFKSRGFVIRTFRKLI